MNAALVTAYGDVSVVKVADVADAKPGKGDLLIRAYAASVSTGDWRIRSLDTPPGFGLMIRLIFGWSKPRHPIFGTECAGVVDSIGPGVQDFRVGDAVIALPKAPRGCHAELVAVAADCVIPKPDCLTWDEAGAFCFGGTTALTFLKKARLTPKDRVLVIGASGSVGSAAVEIAKAYGAHVTGVASEPNRKMVLSLGADDVIDYMAEDVTKRGETWDVVMDTQGVLPFYRARKVLTPEGRYLAVVAGLPAMLGGMLNPFRKQKAIYGIAATGRPILEELAALTEAGAYRPQIDSTYRLDQAREAHARVETHRKRGNVVLRMASD
jgi:NADPH:quinone reductase-like Zn-dependent oxidoreductase